MTFVAALAHRFYLHGYKRRALPRALRRVLARSPLHRAWLAGWNGYFTDVDTGESYGLAHTMRVPPIRNADEYKAALRELSAYVDDEPAAGSAAAARFEALLHEVAAYEAAHFLDQDNHGH